MLTVITLFDEGDRVDGFRVVIGGDEGIRVGCRVGCTSMGTAVAAIDGLKLGPDGCIVGSLVGASAPGTVFNTIKRCSHGNTYWSTLLPPIEHGQKRLPPSAAEHSPLSTYLWPP